ncbi:MAG: hypothetical protein K0R46_1353, partial [Herbinix sp.]|nr:hypothetical protein [Herbinix sp.]
MEKLNNVHAEEEPKVLHQEKMQSTVVS